MPSDVYPIPQTNPLSVPANSMRPIAADPPISLTERRGTDSDSEPGVNATNIPDTMFIRLAMSGALATPGAHPTIVLKANTGAEVEVTTDFPSTISILDGVNPTSAGDATRYPPDVNSVYLVKVFIAITGRNWQIRIKNNDTVAHEFTWVVSDSLGGSRRPWINLTLPPLPPGATTDFDALISQSPAPKLTLTVSNKGTGDLNINDVAGTVAGSPNFVLDTVPGSIIPNSSANLLVAFNPPAAVGPSSTTYQLNTNDGLALTTAGHNRQIALSAVTRKLEITLLLDASGSMAYTPGGVAAVADSDARWGKLKEAARQFLLLLGNFFEGKGRFSVAMFPNITGPTFPPAPSPSAADIRPPDPAPAVNNITMANITDVTNLNGKLDAPPPSLTPRKPLPGGGATPIGFGIGHTIGTTAASFGHFLSDATSKDNDKRFLVLMSDGKHNSGPPDPPFFYGAGPTSFLTKKIKTITVGYGDPAVTAFEVDHVLMQTIATQSGGQFLDAGADDAGLDLKKQFRAALIAGLSLDPTTDPNGALTSGAPEARHKVVVTPYDTKVAFVVNWKTFDARRVSVSILTPTCDLITPEVARNDPHINYDGHLTFAMYTFTHDYLRNAANPANPRYGLWTLVVIGNGLGQGSEIYDYEVITDSRLKLTLTTNRPSYAAGDTIKLNAALTLDGKGIPNASVVLRVTAPGQSSNNWLALNKLTPQEFGRAAEQLKGEDVTAVGIKSFALKLKGLQFDPATRASDITMPDASGQGVYSASYGSTATPGTYDLYVTAVGQTSDGIAFRREKRLSLHLEVRPDPKFSLVDVIYRVRIDGNVLINVADIRVTPRDRFGNVVLIDPAIDPSIKLAAEGVDFTGPLVGNLDGSYSQSLVFKQGFNPAINLTVGSQKIAVNRLLTPVAELRYVDTLIEFRIGARSQEWSKQAH